MKTCTDCGYPFLVRAEACPECGASLCVTCQIKHQCHSADYVEDHRPESPAKESRMSMSKGYVEINGQRLLWRDVVRARKEQREASRQHKEQISLFTSLPDDTRPTGHRKAAGRYLEPTLFD